MSVWGKPAPGCGRPCGSALARRAQDCELVRDLEVVGREAEDGGRASPGAARRAGLPRWLEQPAADEHTLEVGRRDVVAERRTVDLAELGDRERGRCEREADVRVRELPPQALAAGERDRGVVECHPRELVDPVPGRVL